MLNNIKININRLFLGSLITLSSTTLFADGLATNIQPDNIWNGWYIGAQLGGDWSNPDWKFTNYNFFNTNGATLLGNNFRFNESGLVGGGHLGFNYQLQSWLVGLEASMFGTNTKNTIQSPFWKTDFYTTKIDAYGALKGKIGYTTQDYLINVNGGWSFADLSLTQNDPTMFASLASWYNGWVVGAGLDYKLSQYFSVGLAYNYSAVYVNNNVVNCPNCSTGVGYGTPVVDGTITIQDVMARVSYYINIF